MNEITTNFRVMCLKKWLADIAVVVWALRANLRHFLMSEFVTFTIWNCLSVWSKTTVQIRMIISSFSVYAESVAKLGAR